MVRKIAYVDSWQIPEKHLADDEKKIMMDKAIHYVSSNKSLGMTERDSNGPIGICPRVSAGHNDK